MNKSIVIIIDTMIAAQSALRRRGRGGESESAMLRALINDNIYAADARLRSAAARKSADAMRRLPRAFAASVMRDTRCRYATMLSLLLSLLALSASIESLVI